MACSGYHQGGGSQENPENGSSGDSLLTKDDSFNRKVEKQSMEKGTGNESHDWVRAGGRFKNNSEKVTRDMLNKWNFMKHLWRRRLKKEMKKQRSMCQRHSFGGCILVYRYTKEGNINELRHNSMYGYENNRNSLVYRYTRTAPFWGWDEWRECSMVEIDSDHQNLFFNTLS